MKRSFLSGALAVALATGTVVALTAAPAGAAASSCTKLVGNAVSNPGISTSPKIQTVTSTGTQTSCTPKGPTGGSGKFSSTVKTTTPSDCQTLGKGGGTLKGTAQTKWKNGMTSGYSLTVRIGTGANINIATITGRVTSGLFKGHTVTGQLKFTPKTGENCASVPIKHFTLVNTKPFALH